jgi:hypothetical protein
MAGVKAPHGAGGPFEMTGPLYAMADNIFDSFGGTYTGAQYLLITETKPSRLLDHFGWVAYYGIYGYEFINGYGYLTAELPGRNATTPILNQMPAALQSQTKTKVIPK